MIETFFSNATTVYCFSRKKKNLQYDFRAESDLNFCLFYLYLGNKCKYLIIPKNLKLVFYLKSKT